jgi:hypothetical protein
LAALADLGDLASSFSSAAKSRRAISVSVARSEREKRQQETARDSKREEYGVRRE